VHDYQDLFARVKLKLGDQSLDHLLTDERLERMKLDSIDLGLEALLFQYGPYLLIGSSRVCKNPDEGCKRLLG